MQFREPISTILGSKAKDLGQSQIDGVLRQAASEGNEIAFERAIRKGAKINASDPDGFSPLHEASLKGHKHIVLKLIALEAQINLQDNDGWSPLHHTAAAGHLEVVKALIENGADLTAISKSGRTPAQWAIIEKQHAIAGLIYKAVSIKHSKFTKTLYSSVQNKKPRILC